MGGACLGGAAEEHVSELLKCAAAAASGPRTGQSSAFAGRWGRALLPAADGGWWSRILG